MPLLQKALLLCAKRPKTKLLLLPLRLLLL
jgi:hypothetical protein